MFYGFFCLEIRNSQLNPQEVFTHIEETRVLDVAVLAAVRLLTETLVVSLSVVTGPVVTGSLQGTLVNVLLAGLAPEPGPETGALEPVDEVGTGPAVETRRLRTLVNIRLAVRPGIARLADTLSALNRNN